jgi:hypothetical protein
MLYYWAALPTAHISFKKIKIFEGKSLSEFLLS